MSMTGPDGGEREPLAPVIPLFSGGAALGDRRDRSAGLPWHATWVGEEAAGPADAGLRSADDDEAREHGEKLLLRKLRTRSLSLREARTALAADEVEPGTIDEIVESFIARGYLDDLALAEQLIDKALARKAQGRQAIAQTLAQRGIRREVAEAALATLPDDESDRALEFARAKAPQLSGLDHDTALRRLVGQLARRGFGSSALTAAKQALAEAGVRSGPRFR